MGMALLPEVQNAHSCHARADNGLLDLGNLVACPDDGFASAVIDVLHVLVFTLGAFPDLNFAATTDYAHPHRREQIVRGIGVHVHTAVEHRSDVFAESALNQRFASRVLVDEIGHVVDNTGNSDEAAAVVGLLDVILPLDDGKLVKRNPPVQRGALLVKRLLYLLDTTFLNFIGVELLEIVRQSQLTPEPYAPLRGVILVPLNGISII